MITRDRPYPPTNISIQNGYKKLNCIILTAPVLKQTLYS